MQVCSRLPAGSLLTILSVWILLVLGLSNLAVADPLRYPIDVADLSPCEGNKALGLCRPNVAYSAAVLDYISQLRITDLAFYDAFTEDEIFAWFRPAPSLRIPFYVWEDVEGNKEITTDAPSFLQDLYATFSQDAKLSAWRTLDKTEAVVHFVAIPWAPWVADGTHWDAGRVDGFISQILESPEFRRFNGTNFFYVTSGWQAELYLGLDAHGLFDKMAPRGQAPADVIPEPPISHKFQRLAGGMHYGSFPTLRSCSLTLHYSASEALRSERVWPGGSLESYKYPLGHYAQMLKQRPHKFFFAGQIDGRSAYSARRQMLLHRMPRVCKTGVIIRTGGGPDDLMSCAEDSVCQCVPDKSWPRDRNTGLLTQSMFGLFMRGDDYYSARIADIFASGAIPVIVDPVNYGNSMSGQCDMPFRHMAVFLDLAEYEQDPDKALEDAVDKLDAQDLEKMLRLLTYYTSDALHGRFNQSRVAEAKVKQFAIECIPEELLAAFKISKSQLSCNFEDFIYKSAFSMTLDEDDPEMPWGCSFMPDDQCPVHSAVA